MKTKISILIVLFIVVGFSSNSYSAGSSVKAVENHRNDIHKYEHKDQKKKGNCPSGDPKAISITNTTNYPIYYDVTPDDGYGKRLVDWRIKPKQTWNHCRNTNHIVEFDFNLNKAGIQLKSMRIKPGFSYKLVEASQGNIQLRRR